MFLKQSTNSQVVQTPSFVSDTDFKTVQTGLTIANTDVKIIQGGSSTNKNSGGGTHVANGSYSLTFNSTDTATVGRILVSISVSGALPVFFYMTVVEEAVYDMLFGASAIGYIANQPVDVNTIKTQAVTCGAGVTVGAFVGNATAAISVDASGKLLLQATQSGVTIPTVTTVTGQLTAAQIATGVWQDTTAGDFTAANSVGKSIMNGVSLGTGLTIAAVSGAVGSVTGNVGGNVTGSVGSVTGAVGSVTGNVGGNVTGSVGSVVGLTASNLDTTISSRMATYTQPTGFLAATFPTTVASTTNITSASGVALTSSYDFAKGTVAMTESYNTDGAAPTPVQALFLLTQNITEMSISGTTMTIKKLDGSTTAMTLTLDSATTPTSVTRAT